MYPVVLQLLTPMHSFLFQSAEEAWVYIPTPSRFLSSSACPAPLREYGFFQDYRMISRGDAERAGVFRVNYLLYKKGTLPIIKLSS